MKRALISVSDKTGVVDFARGLADMGWELISTGGTYKELLKEGVDVLEVSSVTGFPEAFDGRVKTLHPAVHGGILYRRDNDDDVKTIAEMNIGSIDMVVVNLYPFKEVYEREGSATEDIIENIDIGGPTLVRAASKNYRHVTIVVEPEDYSRVLGELRASGETSLDTRVEMAKKAFSHTAYYDSMIASYFNEVTGEKFPERLLVPYSKKSDLRYGENPHQEGALYVESLGKPSGMASLVQHNGKELSYNNINDLNEGLDLVREFEEPTAVAIKHGNPCGVASDKSLEAAFAKAYESDSQSIYGGIVIFNREVGAELAETLGKIFLEVIVAPSYSEEALCILSQKPNVRVLEQPEASKPLTSSRNLKSVSGGLLVQDKDTKLLGEKLMCVTEAKPDKSTEEDLLFAWKVVKATKSNAVVVAKNKTTVAVGPGQVSRIWALENAIKQGGEGVQGAVLASDAFFPFGDCVELAAKSGIVSIIQPGGAKKDSESIELADKHGISMLFTGIRHFKH